MAHIPNIGKPTPAGPVIIRGTNGIDYAFPQAFVIGIAPNVIQQIAEAVLSTLMARLASSYNLVLQPAPTAAPDLGASSSAESSSENASHEPSAPQSQDASPTETDAASQT